MVHQSIGNYGQVDCTWVLGGPAGVRTSHSQQIVFNFNSTFNGVIEKSITEDTPCQYYNTVNTCCFAIAQYGKYSKKKHIPRALSQQQIYTSLLEKKPTYASFQNHILFLRFSLFSGSLRYFFFPFVRSYR